MMMTKTTKMFEDLCYILHPPFQGVMVRGILVLSWGGEGGPPVLGVCGYGCDDFIILEVRDPPGLMK